MWLATEAVPAALAALPPGPVTLRLRGDQPLDGDAVARIQAGLAQEGVPVQVRLTGDPFALDLVLFHGGGPQASFLFTPILGRVLLWAGVAAGTWWVASGTPGPDQIIAKLGSALLPVVLIGGGIVVLVGLAWRRAY